MDVALLDTIKDRHAQSVVDLDGCYDWIDTIHQDYSELIRALDLHRAQFEIIGRLAVDARNELLDGDASYALRSMSAIHELVMSALLGTPSRIRA